MKKSLVNVLGEEYTCKLGERCEVGLSPDFEGECRPYLKELRVLHSLEGVDSVEEKDSRTEGIVAHEIFHAFVSESGLDIPEDVEETLACWYMKMWRKMNNSILQVLDENGLLD